MKGSVIASIYLDKNRPKKNGLCSVKIRVYQSGIDKRKYYNTNFEFTKDDFNDYWVKGKKSNEHKETILKLQILEAKANEIIYGLENFNFETFEKKLFRNNSDSKNVIYYYDEAIEKLKLNSQIGTAGNYELSKKSILNFINRGNNRKNLKENISFHEITPEFLNKYEKFMLNEMNRSRTTVSMYLRVLRTLFNSAIEQKEINPEIYPFGKSKYQVPQTTKVKKALSKDNLKLLFESKPFTEHQQKAKDFWFFSYACNGMNIKDIVNLKYKDFKGDRFEFIRAKTINTNKSNLKTVTVYLNDFTKNVIETYGNKNKNSDNYVFEIIDRSKDILSQHKQLKNFVRFINQHFGKFAKKLGIDEEISTYWARHSFATNSIRNGASMEFISEALSHSNLKTTIGYFAGFESDKKKELANKLMEF